MDHRKDQLQKKANCVSLVIYGAKFEKSCISINWYGYYWSIPASYHKIGLMYQCRRCLKKIQCRWMCEDAFKPHCDFASIWPRGNQFVNAIFTNMIRFPMQVDNAVATNLL